MKPVVMLSATGRCAQKESADDPLSLLFLQR
jgi:hypothetical protein